MLHSILRNIICCTYQKISAVNLSSEKINDCALVLNFSLHPEENDTEPYPSLHMLIHGIRNYVGVYTAKNGSQKPPPLEDFNCQIYHDSCWRGEIGDILYANKNLIYTVGPCFGNEWYSVKYLNDAQIETLRKLHRR